MTKITTIIFWGGDDKIFVDCWIRIALLGVGYPETWRTGRGITLLVIGATADVAGEGTVGGVVGTPSAARGGWALLLAAGGACRPALSS
jgi:hypothetical protein